MTVDDVKAKPAYRAGFWLFVVLAMIFAAVTVNLFITGGNKASTDAVKSQGARRDCVTTLSAARNAVFQNVDIYKAVLIQAATDKALGFPPAQSLGFYKDIDTKLSSALTEATRLQPATTLNDLIARGGVIDGVRYKRCPT